MNVIWKVSIYEQLSILGNGDIKILKWVFRLWPILAIGLILFAHLLLICKFGLDSTKTNKTISLVLQFAGGLLVLYSLDENLGLFKNANLWKVFVSYLKDFPWLNKSKFVPVGTANEIDIAEKIIPILQRHPSTLEEKMDHLQSELSNLKREIQVQKKEIISQIGRVLKESNKGVAETRKMLKDLENKLQDYTVGGLKTQIFGLLLLMYGALAGYCA